MNMLQQVLQPTHDLLAKEGEEANFRWSWWDEGVVCFTPKMAYDRSVVISAGVHGNETAPIELLFKIYDDLMAGRLQLKVGLLLILGNPEAIRQGVRYINYDMNRMFSGAYQNIEACAETERVQKLEQYCLDFYDIAPYTQRYHYDLHTAIREAVFPTFAMLPYQTHAYDLLLLAQLKCADLDALVYHNSVGMTFSHFSMHVCHAHSVTLELGKAKPFGHNHLADFRGIDLLLRAVIAQDTLPLRRKETIKQFTVQQAIIKKTATFQLNLSPDAANFSQFKRGDWVAKSSEHDVMYATENFYILFPNPNVALGLRAGLLLKRIE